MAAAWDPSTYPFGDPPQAYLAVKPTSHRQSSSAVAVSWWLAPLRCHHLQVHTSDPAAHLHITHVLSPLAFSPAEQIIRSRTAAMRKRGRRSGCRCRYVPQPARMCLASPRQSCLQQVTPPAHSHMMSAEICKIAHSAHHHPRNATASHFCNRPPHPSITAPKRPVQSQDDPRPN